MPLADTHAHLSDASFDSDRQAVVERARLAGVALIVDVGACLASSQRAVALAKSAPGVRASVGIHPHHAANASEAVWEQLGCLAADPVVVAIGETGLDFYRDLSPRATQRDAFDRHLALAQRLSMPAVVQGRDAGAAIIEQLSAYRGRVRGVMHCFSGDLAMLTQVLDLGFWVSVAGNVTYASAAELRETARRVPSERLLIETDCPYLSPAPLRGRRNEPANVSLVVRALAEMRGVEVDQLSESTYRNAESLFGLT